MNRYNISSEGVPAFFNRNDCVFVIGDKFKLQTQIDAIEFRLETIRSKYHVNLHNSIGKTPLADYIGGDVVCPLFDVNRKIRGYIVADSSDNILVDVVEDVVKAAISNQREYLEEIVIAAAFNNPNEFIKSVDSIFGRSKGSDEDSNEAHNNISFDIAGLPVLPFGAAAFGVDVDFDLDLDAVDGLDDLSSSGNIDLSESSLNPKRYLNAHNISSKNKRKFLGNLPAKVSEKYIKQNPNCREDLELLISSVSHEDLQELVLELITRQRGATNIFDFSNLSAASEYEIHVKKWDKSLKGFDHKFQYCIYFKDRKGKEYPIRFQHHPAYCLYIMYIIDRVVRRDEATYLSIRNNREQYIRLCQAVFGEPYDKAEKKYLTFAYRLTKEGEPTRKGRYDDYLKDIDDTITSIVGRADSIPLKIRDGGHLEILPDKIKVDERLLSFKFQ